MKKDNQVKINSLSLDLSAYLLLAFAVMFLAYYGVSAISDPVFSIDFSPYYVAGQLLAEDHPDQLLPDSTEGLFTTSSKPYLNAFRQNFFPDSPVATGWVYPAGYAWIFRPFASLEFDTAARWWLVINMLLSVFSIAMIIWARPWSGNASLSTLRTAWLFFLGLTFQPVLDNLWHGNITALIFFCFSASYLLLRKGSRFWAGFILGLIILIKMTPAIFVVYFLWRRDWKYVGGAIAGSLAIFIVSTLTVGLSGQLAYAALILAQLKAGGVAAFNNQSIAGFLLHALTNGNVNGWETMDVPSWITYVRYLLVAGFAGTVAWVMRVRPEKREQPLFTEDLDLSLLIGVMLLASPITWYHYYFWIFFPLVIVFDHFLSGSPSRRRMVLFAIAYALLVTQAFSQIRSFDPQFIQTVWIMRVLLSTSFLGAVLLMGIILRIRSESK
jgi:hypothetical protein